MSSTPRAPSNVTMACRRDRGVWRQRPPASVGGLCAGRSGAYLRVRTTTSAHRSGWVPPLRRSLPGPVGLCDEGSEPRSSSQVAVGLPAVTGLTSRIGSIGHRWLAGGVRPRVRQPSVTSRRCGAERIGRRGSGHGDRQTGGCGETLEWRLRTGKARVRGLRITRSTPTTGRPQDRGPRDRCNGEEGEPNPCGSTVIGGLRSPGEPQERSRLVAVT